MVESDSYRVQSDSNMVERDLNCWSEPKFGTMLTYMKVELRGGKRISNWMYIKLTCYFYKKIVESDSYMVQNYSNMVKNDLQGWLEPKCRTN